MKHLPLLLFWILISAHLSVTAQVTYEQGNLLMENEKMIRTLSFTEGKIIPGSLYSKTLKKELFAQKNLPWFEMIINKQRITSGDPIWKYKKHEVRMLNNGGTEVKITVEATRKVPGLQIDIYRQIFPESTIIREKLVLRSESKKFTMNKNGNDLHFIFPRYSLHMDAGQLNTEEIRIATFASEILDNFDSEVSIDERKWDNVRDINLAHCHMFHPAKTTGMLQPGDSAIIKGPFGMYSSRDLIWMSTYEHASQDRNFGTEHRQARARQHQNQPETDQQQGVEGSSGLAPSDEDFWFLGLKSVKTAQNLYVSLEQLRGGYLEGEIIDPLHPYETVWSTFSFFTLKEEISPAIHEYLWNQITEHPESRKSHFYYNTWGMQRDNRNTTGLREIFTEERILKEIRNAAELQVDLFVLDDGWEQTMGVWQPHKTRLPNGLASLIHEMNKHRIIPGAWLSPMGIDSLAERYIQHPEWVIKDEGGKPIKAQWGFPAFDFVSGFYDLFVQDCKSLVDQGIRFFKWDAINTFDSMLPGLDHGGPDHSAREIRDRYAYLLPFYVTRAMKELREYHPEVTVEIDLTEKERCIIGLMPLQEGKFFWMNNGGSAYNDYSTHRTKSMRTVINRYAGLIPTELFTQAVYPHNMAPFYAQRYNVNTSLVAGRGFWGNLELMNPEQRRRVGESVEKCKRVLPYIAHLPLQVTGGIGSSPELYIHVNQEKGAGQVIAFSGAVTEHDVTLDMPTDSCLAILHNTYSIKTSGIEIPLQFPMPESSREAFILPNLGTGIQVISSTAWLKDVRLDTEKKSLTIVPGGKGTITVKIPGNTAHLRTGTSEDPGVMQKEKGITRIEVRTEKEKMLTFYW